MCQYPTRRPEKSTKYRSLIGDDRPVIEPDISRAQVFSCRYGNIFGLPLGIYKFRYVRVYVCVYLLILLFIYHIILHKNLYTLWEYLNKYLLEIFYLMRTHISTRQLVSKIKYINSSNTSISTFKKHSLVSSSYFLLPNASDICLLQKFEIFYLSYFSPYRPRLSLTVCKYSLLSILFSSRYLFSISRILSISIFVVSDEGNLYGKNSEHRISLWPATLYSE
jgi:hypothetical protein